MSQYFKAHKDYLESIKPEDILTEEGIKQKKFTRNRTITIPIIIKFLYFLGTLSQKKSMASTLFSMWEYLELTSKVPSRQAMYDALRYISEEKFKQIMLNIPYNFEEHHIKLFYGKNMYLADGTNCRLPRNKETLELYGCPKTGKKFSHYPQSKALTLLEVGTNVTRSLVMGRVNASERHLLIDAVDQVEKGSVIIADCGFHSAAVAFLLEKKGYSFLIRINEINSKKFISNINFINDTALVKMKITKCMRKKYKGLEDAPEFIEVRIIKVRDASIGKRAVYLITDMREPPTEELADLYWDRQRIEDSYKYKKVYGGLEEIHPNTKSHLMNLAIFGVIGYHNMMQLALAKISETPSPNENQLTVLNRKVGWENTMPIFFKYITKGIVESDFIELLDRTKNEIRIDRYAPRVLKKPQTRYKNRKENTKNCDDRKLTSKVEDNDDAA